MFPFTFHARPAVSAPPLLAWVDSAGCVLLVPGDRLTVGGPPRRGGSAVLPLVAPLRAVHAEVRRAGEGWAVAGVGGPLTDEGDADGDDADERSADRFSLGPDGAVRCAVRAPNALSPAAVLTVGSGHPPAPGLGAARLEAAVIAAGPVLIGPTADCHVRVRGAGGRVILRCGADGWAARGLSSVNGSPTAGHPGGPAALDWRPVAAGDALAGGGVTLRLAAAAGADD